MADSEAEVVYVIGAAGSSVAKIGRSTDLNGRLAAIQRMSPVRLAVLWSIAGGCALEAALHRRFKQLRTHGEWFDFGQDDPARAVEAAVADLLLEAAIEDERQADNAEREARREQLRAAIRSQAELNREGERAMLLLVLKARSGNTSLREIAGDAGMTAEGVRKMIARAEKAAAEQAAAEAATGEPCAAS